MTRPLRIEFPGAVYHITSRGNAKQVIFLDDKDRNNFLIILSLIVKRFSVFLKDKDKIKEVSKIQRYVARPKLSEIFADNKIRDKKTRNQATYLAYIRDGYTFKEIAEYLNLHYTTISRSVREIEKKYDNARSDPKICCWQGLTQ